MGGYFWAMKLYEPNFQDQGILVIKFSAVFSNPHVPATTYTESYILK